MAILIGWITGAIIYGTVILYGAVGETITEKAGNLNLGTPGIMCMGGGFGFASAFIYENSVANPNAFVCILITIFSSFLMGALGGLIYAFLTATLRVNQNVVGLTLTIFGVGLGTFFAKLSLKGKPVASVEFANKVFNAKIPFLSSKLGFVSEILFSYGFMVYIGIIIAIVTTLFLKKTRAGLNLRAVGENPGTADAAGINVIKYKYLATCIGSGITGLGGWAFVIGQNNGALAASDIKVVEGIAWLSVALVIFIRWKPVNAIWGAFLFGFCYYSQTNLGKVLHIKINANLIEMLPYVVTIVVLIIMSIKQKKDSQAPASLGLSYFREDR